MKRGDLRDFLAVQHQVEALAGVTTDWVIIFQSISDLVRKCTATFTIVVVVNTWLARAVNARDQSSEWRVQSIKVYKTLASPC